VAHDVPAEPFVYDWFAAKSMDGSLPLGPGITPAFQVPDPQDLRLRLWVNGELQQDESTADMVCTAGPSATAPPGLDDGLRARIADQLAGRFKGDIIGPDHPQYDAARQVWNSMIDRSPGLILRCTSTADVVAAVNVARDNGLYPSVRCGGHNSAPTTPSFPRRPANARRRQNPPDWRPRQGGSVVPRARYQPIMDQPGRGRGVRRG
jgi:fumarylacetoacetase-like protein